MEIPKFYQDINATHIEHEGTDFDAQLVAVKRLFMSETDELQRDINRVREIIDKSDQNTGNNNLY